MNRLLATLRWDVTLQWRNGFYYVSAFVVVVSGTVLGQLPRLWLDLLLPAFLVSSLSFTTYYFMGALVLLEKGQRTLEGLVVTPLRPGEYLASKSGSLAALAVVESLLIVLMAAGMRADISWLALGVASLGVIFTLFGFVAIARYDSLNEYLLPSLGIVSLLTFPLIGSLGLWQSPLFYLHPIQPSLVLMRAALEPAEPWQLAYGLAGSFFWVALSFRWARHRFYRFVVRRAGD